MTVTDPIKNLDHPSADWQGMESAPKDGTRILLAWADGWVDIGKWIAIERETKWGDDPSAPSSRSGWAEDKRDVSWIDSHPICWMPLPSLPSWLEPTSLLDAGSFADVAKRPSKLP